MKLQPYKGLVGHGQVRLTVSLEGTKGLRKQEESSTWGLHGETEVSKISTGSAVNIVPSSVWVRKHHCPE